MDPATSEATGIENVRSARCSIPAETLDSLMCGMPECMRAVWRSVGLQQINHKQASPCFIITASG